MGELGIAGGFFILLIALLVGSYRLAMQYMVNLGKKKTSTPEKAPERNVPGPGTLFDMTKKQIDAAKETGEGRLKRVEEDFKEFKAKKEGKDDDQEKTLSNLKGRVIRLEEWRISLEKKN